MSEEEFQDLKTKVAVLSDRSEAQQKTVADLVSLDSTLKAVSFVAAFLGLTGLASLVFSGWITCTFFLNKLMSSIGDYDGLFDSGECR